MDSKKKLYLILGGTALGLSLVGYFLYTRGTLRMLQNKFNEMLNKPPANTGNNSIPNTPTNGVNDSFPLSKGSRGPRVIALQNALIGMGSTITADGIFGPTTLAALQAQLNISTVTDDQHLNSITGDSNEAVEITSGSDIKSLADRAQYAMQGIGCDIVELAEIIKTLNSNADYDALRTAFGTRKGQTLEQWFDGEFQLSGGWVKTKLADRGITNYKAATGRDIYQMAVGKDIY